MVCRNASLIPLPRWSNHGKNYHTSVPVYFLFVPRALSPCVLWCKSTDTFFLYQAELGFVVCKYQGARIGHTDRSHRVPSPCYPWLSTALRRSQSRPIS